MWKRLKEVVRQQVTVADDSVVGKIIQTINVNLLLPWPWTVGILLLVAAILVGKAYGPGLYHLYTHKAGPNDILILISDFEDNSSRDYNPADAIEETLRRSLLDYDLPNVKLVRIERTFKRAQFEEVQEIGQKYNATLFIWGHYDDAGMYPRFTVLKQEKTEVTPGQPAERWDNLASPPADFSQYVNFDLPVQMTFLTDFVLGQIFHFDAAYAQALELFEAAIRSADELDANNQIPPQNIAPVFFYMGYIHLQVQKDLDKALDDYDQAARLAPDSADAFNNRGLVYHRRGQFEQAISDFDRALALDPQHAVAHHNRGLSYFAVGKKTSALADISRAIELGRSGPEVHYDRGIIYFSLGNFQLALDDFSQAIELDPTYVDAYFNRGLAYFQLAKFEEAIVDFREALELDPDFATAANDLCWTGSLTGRAAEVINACERAVKLAPKRFKSRDSRGIARALTGDIPGALDDFRFVVTSLEGDKEYETQRLERETWIGELEKGNNPFNQSVLQDLLNQ